LLVGTGPSDAKHDESDTVESSGDAQASPGSRPHGGPTPLGAYRTGIAENVIAAGAPRDYIPSLVGRPTRFEHKPRARRFETVKLRLAANPEATVPSLRTTRVRL